MVRTHAPRRSSQDGQSDTSSLIQMPRAPGSDTTVGRFSTSGQCEGPAEQLVVDLWDRVNVDLRGGGTLPVVRGGGPDRCGRVPVGWSRVPCFHRRSADANIDLIAIYLDRMR